MLKIGDFSKLSRVSIRMLRHYDALGLLTPAMTDGATGYRYYAEEQLGTAGKIAALRDMGFGLAAIGDILRSGEDPACLETHFLLRRQELQREAEAAAYRLRLLDTAMEGLRKGTAMNYDVVLKTLPERYAACLRMTIPTYEQEGLLWEILMGETAPLHLRPDDPCLCAVTFYDGEYKERDVDVEAWKTVKGTYPDTEHVRFRLLPAVTFASAVYRGPYGGIGAANEAVAAWVRDNGYIFDGPAFNIYHISPHETQNPEEFVTEVCYPVRRAEHGV